MGRCAGSVWPTSQSKTWLLIVRWVLLGVGAGSDEIVDVIGVGVEVAIDVVSEGVDLVHGGIDGAEKVHDVVIL